MEMLKQVIAIVKRVAEKDVMPRFMQVGRQHKGDGSFYTEADLLRKRA